MTGIFTGENAWRGGDLELAVCVDNDQAVPLLEAIWSHESLQGCYLDSKTDPSEQARISVAEAGLSVPLLGIANIDAVGLVPCSTTYLAFEDTASRWLSLSLPRAPIMASSRDDAGDELMELAVEFWLRRIAETLHSVSRFDFALIGVLEAVHYSSMHLMTIDDVPKRRSFEYLMTSSRALASFPRNINFIRKY